DRAERVVELDGGPVPLEDRPVEAPVAVRDAEAREFAQERRAVAAPSVRGVDIEVFEMNAVPAGPRGEVEEPHGDARDPALGLDDVRVNGGAGPEQGRLEVRGGRLDRLGLS